MQSMMLGCFVVIAHTKGVGGRWADASCLIFRILRTVESATMASLLPLGCRLRLF
jgi:hypothetical protein